MSYVPAPWLPGPNLMTVYAGVARLAPRLRPRRVRWELPDGDFLDVDRHEAAARPPRAGLALRPGDGGDPPPVLVVCHGLEGSSRAPYVLGLVGLAVESGLDAVAVNFRGCSGEPNRLPRLYHSGETGDLRHVVERLAREAPGRPILLAGFSLGGNVVVKYLGESGEALPAEVRGGAAISVPFDLEAGAAAIDAPGFWSFVYRERFMRRLRRKAAEKAQRFPGAFDGARAAAARTFAEFDEAVTAPLHGFASAREYWRRSSAGRFLAGVARPLLALSSLDDPIVPASTIPVAAARENPRITLETTAAGGHVAFVSGWPLRASYWAERRAVEFLAALCARGP
jgi:predicted alpha/beta-fold hydrolase